MPKPPQRPPPEPTPRRPQPIDLEGRVTIVLEQGGAQDNAAVLAAIAALSDKVDQLLAQPAQLQAIIDRLQQTSAGLTTDAAELQSATDANAPKDG